MPAFGDQYGNIENPFEERVVNKFTAQEIATLQSRLNQQLGPEYISQRPGNGGGRVAYLEGHKAMTLANEVFGFNGWSSCVRSTEVDFVDEHPQTGKISIGLSVVVRITLKDGTYHEDIGYGSASNQKDKAAAFEKSKKEAITDGIKRALRTFGNVLGNCLYDKEYLKKVQTMKVKPVKFEESTLHRHKDFAPRPKEEGIPQVKTELHQTPARLNNLLRTRTDHITREVSGEFDDDFDGNLFDGVDIAEPNEDNFVTGTRPAPVDAPMLAIEAEKSTSTTNGPATSHGASAPTTGPPRHPNIHPRVQAVPATRTQHGASHHPQQQQQQPQEPGRPPLSGSTAKGPQTPIPQQSNIRPDQNRQPRVPPPTVDIHSARKPPQHSHVQQQNQTPRTTPPQAQQSNPALTTSTTNAPPIQRPPVGFVTSRAAELMQNAESSSSLSTLPAFNPRVDSPVPKEQRTPGIDHTRSIPIKRQEVGAPPPPPAQPQLGGGFNRPGPGAGRGNMNFVNPQQDANRRIGMPGGAGTGMCPGVNRGAFKQPMKRPPLQDVSNHGVHSRIEGEPDTKRRRVEVDGAENAGAAVVGNT